MDILDQISAKRMKEEVTQFGIGDTVRVDVRVVGQREREAVGLRPTLAGQDRVAHREVKPGVEAGDLPHGERGQQDEDEHERHSAGPGRTRRLLLHAIPVGAAYSFLGQAPRMA